MEFKILSHACMVVKTKEGSVIIDPWLLGSCYWRSWWNFPEPQFDRDTIEKVDAVIISHSHWDHWHGPTLKKYFREKPIYISDEFNARSKIDLHSIGFKNVKTIPHGRNVKIANLKIHFFE